MVCMTINEYMIIGCLLFFDQVTKLLASSALVYGEPYQIFSILYFTLVHNYGAAFSLLADAGGWQNYMFLSVAFLLVGYAFYALYRGDVVRWSRFGLVLLIAGGIGNAIDRLIFGYVVDFIHLSWNGLSFPVFNIADSTITVAAICLFLGIRFDQNALHSR